MEYHMGPHGSPSIHALFLEPNISFIGFCTYMCEFDHSYAINQEEKPLRPHYPWAWAPDD